MAQPEDTPGADTLSEGERRSQVRKAATASVVGTSIEWYDFFLYGTAAALVFPKVFFPGASEYIGTLQAFATYAVGFAARPVGAAIFGHWGDRLGRKVTLIVTLVLMGISTAMIGLLPGASSIGAAAPILLIVLRLLQGVAVGGEWSGSVLLSMEWGNQKRRGLMASWPQVGVPIGLLLGTGAMSAFAAVAGDAFVSWGWRVPFLLSLLLVAIGLYVRLKILETPMFARLVQQKAVAKLPVVEAVKRFPKEIALTALVRYSEQMPFYILTAFVLTYVTGQTGLSRTFALNAVLAAAALELFLMPTFGHLSDTLGRRKVYATGAVLIAVIAIPYFALLSSGIAAVVFFTIVLSMVPHAMQYGPQASLIAESFPTGLRYGGAGLGYQLSSVIAGGPGPLIATFLLHEFGTAYAISGYMIAGAVLTLVAVAFLPDRSKADITDDSVYVGRRTAGAETSGP